MGLTQVTGKGITDGTIFDVDVHASAAIAGSKITPSFTSDVTITEANPALNFVDSNNNPDYRIYVESGSFLIQDATNSNANRIAINSDGNVTVPGNFDVVGNIATNGTVDGRDVAADGTKLDGIESNATADQTASEIVALIADQTIAPSIIDMEDNEKIKLGNSDDLEIYHSGSHSRFLDNGAGKIQFGSDTGVEVLTANFATQIALFDSTQILLKENTSITGNLAVSGTVDGVDVATRDTLFGGLTSSSGVLTNGVTATTQSAGDNSTKVATTAYTDTAIANLADSAPSTLNTLNELAAALGDDANFSTTVTNSIATKMPLAGGTFTGDVTFDGATAGRDIVFDRSDNALELAGYAQIKFADQASARFGTDEDLKIYHDGSSSNIKNDGTGSLNLWGSEVRGISSGGSEYLFRAFENGSVELYHNNSKKFETQSSGVHITGDVSITGHYLADDNEKLKMGNGFDLEIYHDGSNSYIVDQGTGSLIIQGSQTLTRNTSGHNQIVANNDVVELYYDNSKVFETTTHGVQVTDNNDNVQIDMVDSSGITGYLYGSGTNFGLLDKSGNWKVKVAHNAQVELYYHTTKRLETTSSGVNVVGALTINGAALGGGNPTGTVISYAGSSAPTGYLKANGDSIPNGSGTVQGVTEDFSDLYAVVGSSLPDLRGEFVRGLDDGRGVDSGRSIRSSQSGQNVSHSHTTNSTLNHNNNNSKDLQGQFNGEERDGRPTGVFYTVGGRGRDFDGGDGDYIGFDGRHRHGTTSSGGSEARPRNVALLMCIKY